MTKDATRDKARFISSGISGSETWGQESVSTFFFVPGKMPAVARSVPYLRSTSADADDVVGSSEGARPARSEDVMQLLDEHQERFDSVYRRLAQPDGQGFPSQFPTYYQIVEINKRLIERYGGAGSRVVHEGPLRYVLQAIQGKVFGVDRYPSLEEKACAAAYAIIDGHVFDDGNKRTGAEVLVQILELNCHRFDPDDDEFEKMMYRIAGEGEEKLEFDEFVTWASANSRPKAGECIGDSES